MENNKENLKAAFSKLLESLKEVAMSDSRLTEEEVSLLDMIKEEINNYTRKLDNLPEDINEEELAKNVEKKIENIVSKAIEISKINNVISDDEIQILKTLMDFKPFTN